MDVHSNRQQRPFPDRQFHAWWHGIGRNRLLPGIGRFNTYRHDHRRDDHLRPRASTATIALTSLASGPGKSATLTLASGSYTVGTVAGTSVAISAASAGSLSDADIGSPALAGSASYNSSTGVWTQSGGGSDIWSTSDQFNFASTTITGDATLIAEITSLSNTDPWAKGGLMFRNTSAANSANVALVATPGNGVSFQWRTSAGGASGYTNIGSIPVPSPSAPVWLQLTARGNVFTASYSTDGTTYHVVGTQTVALSSSLLAGLAVTAHNNGLLGRRLHSPMLQFHIRRRDIGPGQAGVWRPLPRWE